MVSKKIGSGDLLTLMKMASRICGGIKIVQLKAAIN